jgi:hypothetical protein
MDLEELDLQGITLACERKYEHSIPNQQIRLLQSASIKLRNKEKGTTTQKGKSIGTTSLGIKNTSKKDIIKDPKDEKQEKVPPTSNSYKNWENSI